MRDVDCISGMILGSKCSRFSWWKLKLLSFDLLRSGKLGLGRNLYQGGEWGSKGKRGEGLGVYQSLDSRSKRWKHKALIRVIVLCSWTRHLNVTVHIPSQECRWVPANEWGKRQIVTLGGVYCRPAFLSRGVAIFLVVSCFRNRDICHLSSVKTFFSVDGCVLMTCFFS